MVPRRRFKMNNKKRFALKMFADSGLFGLNIFFLETYIAANTFTFNIYLLNNNTI